MKKILSKFEKMEKWAYISLNIGLFIVVTASIILLAYIIKADCFKEYNMLKNTIPSVVMSVFVVLGGGFALDAVIKEKRN